MIGINYLASPLLDEFYLRI